MSRWTLWLATALVATACGGDAEPGEPRAVDELEYAQVVVGADTDFWLGLNQATEQFTRAGPATVSAERAFGVFALLAIRYADDLGATMPPAPLLAAHEAYVGSLLAVAEAFTDAAQGRSQVSFADVLVAEPALGERLDAANLRLRDDCTNLEEALVAAGQSVALRCTSFQ